TQVAEATAGAGDTIVADAATLQLQGTGNVASEDLTINGVGIGNAGALQNVSGNNAWGKPITLGSNSSIGVTGARDTLVTNQPITGTGFGVTKVGPGTPDFAGTRATTYTALTKINER